MLGMYSDFTPKFVKKFADVGSVMTGAFKGYDEAVKSGEFPASEHEFSIPGEIMDKIREENDKWYL